jgi:hypothetical protein
VVADAGVAGTDFLSGSGLAEGLTGISEAADLLEGVSSLSLITKESEVFSFPAEDFVERALFSKS